MKRSIAFGITLFLTAVPVAAPAAMPLAASQVQRQTILDLEYQLNVPGTPAARATAIQNQIASLEAQINGSDVPALSVPVYGGCEADQSVLSYLQDEVQNGDLDQDTLYTYRRNIYDLQVNLRQRGC